MSYPVNTPITYTAVAASDAPYNAGPFTYAWTFDDGGTAATASYAKTWTTNGSHTATVVATNTATGVTSPSVTKTVNIATPTPGLGDTLTNACFFVSGTKYWALSTFNQRAYLFNGTSWSSYGALSGSWGGYYTKHGPCSSASGGYAVVALGNYGSGMTKMTVFNTTTNALSYADTASVAANGTWTSDPPIIYPLPNGKFHVVFSETFTGLGYLWSLWLDASNQTFQSISRNTVVSAQSEFVFYTDAGDCYCVNGSDNNAKKYVYAVGGGTWSSITLANKPIDFNALWYSRIIGRCKIDATRWFLAGGSGSGPTVLTAIWDPATLSFTAKSNMTTARDCHGMVTLQSGKVLIVGGKSGAGTATALNTGEVYDPATNTYTAVTGTMSKKRCYIQQQCFLTPSGNVAICGGTDETGTDLSSVEYYRVATNDFGTVE